MSEILLSSWKKVIFIFLAFNIFLLNLNIVNANANGNWVNIWGSRYYIVDEEIPGSVKTSYGNALTGLQTIDDSIYYFRADGRLLCTDYGTNIYNYNGIDYYYEIGSGKLTALSEYTGLAKQYQYTFYYINGQKQIGWQLIDSNTYYFLDDGKTGYGRAATGNIIIDDIDYTFDSNGVLISNNSPFNQKGEWELKYGKYYTYIVNGEYVTGFKIIDEKLYYFKNDGILQTKRTDGTDVSTIEGIDYYHYDDNSLELLSEHTGIVKIYAHRWLYINGVKTSGWHEIDGDIYYANSAGRILTGDQKIQDVICHFDNTGKFISSDEEIDISNKQPTIHIEVPDYKYTQCNITAQEWNNKTTYGWNLGNALSSVYGDWDKTTDIYINQEEMWGQPKTSLELIQNVKAQGFNSIRIPVTFYKNSYQDENGNYHINKEWLNRVAEVVEMCLQNDMTVYICPMCDSLGNGPIVLGQDDETMKDVYKYCEDIWTDIAERFKYFDGRLAFESYNEVWIKGYGKTVYTKLGHEQMNKINQIFVDTIRKSGAANSDRVLILASYGHEYDYGALNDFVLPIDSAQNRLIVSVHEYAQAFDQQLDSIMRQIADFQAKIGVPVIINEWGFTDGVTLNDKTIQEAAYANFSFISNKYGIKSYVWDNGALNSFGLISRTNFNHSEKELLYAITHPQENITTDAILISSVNHSQMNLQYRFKKDNSGIEYHPWWGFLAFGEEKHGYEIPNGAKYFESSILKHTTDLKAIRFESFVCKFYDENDNYITTKSWKNNGTIIEIPEGAKYVRVLTYNQFEACTPDQITEWFENGELTFYCSFIQNDYSNMTYKR